MGLPGVGVCRPLSRPESPGRPPPPAWLPPPAPRSPGLASLPPLRPPKRQTFPPGRPAGPPAAPVRPRGAVHLASPPGVRVPHACRRAERAPSGGEEGPAGPASRPPKRVCPGPVLYLRGRKTQLT
ncbi:collagen alpha-1(I) chain-like [Globicephala melas]|uniref:collagen alpha-1(I) chain-like n=1 Tax=Pseudorca crassidens TaxID=82174 RepID=UPI00352E88AC